MQPLHGPYPLPTCTPTSAGAAYPETILHAFVASDLCVSNRADIRFPHRGMKWVLQHRTLQSLARARPYLHIFKVIAISIDLWEPSIFDFCKWDCGIEPDKGKGISSPGTYEASVMWPPDDGERQWNSMSDWTCR